MGPRSVWKSILLACWRHFGQRAAPMRLQVVQSHELIVSDAISIQDITVTEFVIHDEDDPARPRDRNECKSIPRPCPFVTCRYNLYLDVRGDGVLRINFPDREPEDMLASCALDLAEDGPRTLDSVAGLMGMSKERARQIETAAMQKLRVALGTKEYHDLDEEF